MKQEKKRLLIYAHYYIPDTASTGQLLNELAEGMVDVFDITVICVVPSYQGSVDNFYRKKKFYLETLNGVKILRIRVSEFSKDSKRSRIKNIMDYFFGALIATFKVGKMDFVFSISQPPILGGLLGVWGKYVKRAKYIYNIQDFNPEQVIAISYDENNLILKIMMLLDKFSCRCSDIVITVGRDLEETLQNRFQGKKIPKTVLINNWIDEKHIFPLPKNHEKVLAFKKKYNLTDKFIFMYSGNIGLYYDLENLISVIEQFKPDTKTVDDKEVLFVFIGNGSLLKKLKQYVKEKSMINVIFIPYQDKDDLIYSLNAADVHWCLNAKGIKGVSCPSKYYGIAAVGKPVIGVLEKGSEIRCIIDEVKGGLCSNPQEYNEIKDNINWFIHNADKLEDMNIGLHNYSYLLENFTKDVSINKYKRVILGDIS